MTEDGVEVKEQGGGRAREDSKKIDILIQSMS